MSKKKNVCHSVAVCKPTGLTNEIGRFSIVSHCWHTGCDEHMLYICNLWAQDELIKEGLIIHTHFIWQEKEQVQGAPLFLTTFPPVNDLVHGFPPSYRSMAAIVSLSHSPRWSPWSTTNTSGVSPLYLRRSVCILTAGFLLSVMWIFLLTLYETWKG